MPYLGVPPYVEKCQQVVEAGYEVIVPDLRGYGDSGLSAKE